MATYKEVEDEQFKKIIYDIYELTDGRLALVLFKVDKDPISVLGFAYIDEPQHLINILSNLEAFANTDIRFTRGADIDVENIQYLLETINFHGFGFIRITCWESMNDSIKQVFTLRDNQYNN